MRQRILLGAGAALAAAAIFAVVNIDGRARIGAGYKAKVLCSEIFVAGRDADMVQEVEFEGVSPILDKIGVKVNQKYRFISASLYGFGRAKAIYRDGYGCTLVNGGRVVELPTPAPAKAADLWRMATADSNRTMTTVNYDELNDVIDDAFRINDANHRSLLVAVDGQIIAEQYAKGFTADTAFLSWSMGKSVTATLIGAAVLKGYIDVDAPAPVAQWRDRDPRHAITWNDLLRMQSGLEFEEEYGDTRSDVNRMLFASSDAGAIAANKPLAHPPGEVWYYSSGTTNLIMRTLRAVLAERGLDLHSFAREAIFEPIGAASITLEVDAAGNALGSSYVYATTRDWARLGQLYLQNGVWDEKRLLPEGWSKYVSNPTLASDGEYGAHFWLNLDGANGRKRYLPGMPEDVYFMAGHEGQYVFIIPSKNAIIVRTGMTRGQTPIDVVAPIVAAIDLAISSPPDPS